MKATRDYGSCGRCGANINKGDDFVIVDGAFIHDACAKHADTPEGKAQPKAQPKPMRKNTPPAAQAASKPQATPKPKQALKPAAAAPVGAQEAAPAPAIAKPVAKVRPKAISSVKTMTANGITVKLICGQKHTDEEIVAKVLEIYADRPETRIKADIATNRSDLNRGMYLVVREQYGFPVGTKAVRMMRKSGKLVPWTPEPKPEPKTKTKAKVEVAPVAEVVQKPQPRKKLNTAGIANATSAGSR